MTDAEYNRGELSFKMRIGRARGKVRRAETLAAKAAALKVVKDLETGQRRFRLNRFADGA